MKIRDRLTLAYGLTAFAVMTTLGITLFESTCYFHEQEFFERLEERVQITEQILLEKNAQVSQAVRDKFLQRLDKEEEYAVSLQPSGLDSLDALFYPNFSQEISSNALLRFRVRDRQGVGKIYNLHDGKYAVVVTAEDVFGNSKLAFLRKILFAGIFAGLMVMVAVGYYSSRRALQPLEVKIRKASTISASNLAQRMEVSNPSDEIGQMTVAFNRMLDRIQAGFDAQRGFVSNASHEIRNPLTAIIGEAEVLLERNRTPEEYRATLHNIVAEAERLQLLTTQLLTLSKAEAMDSLSDLEETQLDQFLLEILERFPAHRLHINFLSSDNEPLVLANKPLLHTALSNIIDNALKYSDDQLVKVELLEVAGAYQIRVMDLGIGISATDLQHIYVPLFRSRNARRHRGHGVGLPLARRIILLHKGDLLVESAGEDKGTTVTVTLPKQ